MIETAKAKEPVELEPDAWARFERAVDVVAKSPPQHRAKPTKRNRKKPKPSATEQKSSR